MAKNNKKQRSMEDTLWDSANKLRGSVEPSEYIGTSTTAIDKNIAALKKKNIIRRIGGAKGGHWEIREIKNKR